MNPKCEINEQMFVLNKGYQEFEESSELESIRCPLCKQVKIEV